MHYIRYGHSRPEFCRYLRIPRIRVTKRVARGQRFRCTGLVGALPYMAVYFVRKYPPDYYL
jgi:hypothetical protein